MVVVSRYVSMMFQVFNVTAMLDMFYTMMDTLVEVTSIPTKCVDLERNYNNNLYLYSTVH